jgi:hypothetical protein
MARPLSARLGLSYFVAALTLGLGWFAVESRIAADGPDRELTWVREYSSELSQDTLALALQATVNWPEWHYHATQAQAVDPDGKPLPMNFQSVETGSLVQLELVPKADPRKRFIARLQVKEFVPKQALHVEWIWDSHGKIARVVDSLEWRIELSPQEKGTKVKQQIWARTRGPRARWFARFAPGIYLHQLAMADMEKLILLKRPSGVIPIPHAHR